MTMPAKILLKIISGPHLGAEIPLTSGSTVLGSSNSCDIILQDSTVAERHLRISLSKNQKRGEPLLIKTIDAPVIVITSGESSNTHLDDNVEPGKDLDSQKDDQQ